LKLKIEFEQQTGKTGATREGTAGKNDFAMKSPSLAEHGQLFRSNERCSSVSGPRLLNPRTCTVSDHSSAYLIIKEAAAASSSAIALQ
jgi:hypothetical protein